MTSVYVMFLDYPTGVDGPTIGPFEWVQERHGELVKSPNGETIAYKPADDNWLFQGQSYSDIVVMGEKP